MLISVTERCSWENESWTYVFDMKNIEGAVMEWLLLFQMVANRYYDECLAEAKKNIIRGGFLRSARLPPFAASRYSIDFWDSIERKAGDSKRYIALRKRGTSRLVNIFDVGYNASELLLSSEISFRRIKSAAEKMRDKKENTLYKNFTSVLLKSKKTVCG